MGTETVYDALGRVEETRRWADVQITIITDTAPNGEIITRATGWTTEGAAAVAGSELSYNRTSPSAFKFFSRHRTENTTELKQTEGRPVSLEGKAIDGKKLAADE